jgi:hypothetical protein
MNKYENGKIYRLVCNNTGLNYYGSTTQKLPQRLYEHKRSYKKYINKNLTANKIIEGGNFNIILVEEYSCQNRQQLEAKERYYIENNECVNKNIPTQNDKEYYLKNKDKINQYNNEYYKLNKDNHKEYYKVYNETNKDKIKEQTKKYRESNKDKIKEYYQLNKEKIKEQVRINREKHKNNIL